MIYMSYDVFPRVAVLGVALTSDLAANESSGCRYTHLCNYEFYNTYTTNFFAGHLTLWMLDLV